MPASGPVNEPKLDPARAMEDQGSEPTEIVLGTPPFSSPDPATDGLKMLPLEDGTSAYEARQDAAAVRSAGEDGDYSSMSKKELQDLAAQRDVDVDGLKKDEIVSALQADDASDMKASDFKDQIAAAQDQDALDSVAELYSASGRSYSSVEAALEKRQGEIDDAGNSN